VAKNPKRVGTNSNLVKFVVSNLAVNNPPVARTEPCRVKNPVENPAQKTNPVQIFFDGAIPFYRAVKNLQVFAIHVNPANNKNPHLEPKPIKLPEKYKDFANVFEKNKADQLLEHRPYDCPIDLEEGHSPPSLLHIVPFCEGPNKKPEGFAKQKQPAIFAMRHASQLVQHHLTRSQVTR
jgi:hypothetical protein